MKIDTEADMLTSLGDIKHKILVSDAMFFKLLDNVGFKSKEQENVLEQLLPTEYYIGYEFIETNRKEVSSCNVHVSTNVLLWT